MIYDLIFFGILFIILIVFAGVAWERLPVGWKSLIKKILKTLLKRVGFYKQK